jgi:hypothetical protein
MSGNPFEIPEFLRVKPEDVAARSAAWDEYERRHKLRRRSGGAYSRRKPWGLPLTYDATAKAIAKEIEANKTRALKARLAQLRETAK